MFHCRQRCRGRPASCLPNEYTNFLTLCGLPPHKLNIKLGAPIMLLCDTHVDPVRGHALRWQYITARIACGEYSGSVLLLPSNPLSLPDAGVVPLDNLCLTDIDSPRSKYNAKPQSCEARRTVACIAKNNVLFFLCGDRKSFL